LRGYLADGPQLASPLLIQHAMPSTAAGVISIEKDLHGPNVTVHHRNGSPLLALGHAAAWLALGRADAVLVVAVDEVSPATLHAHARFGVLTTGAMRPYDVTADGFVLGEAAVAFVLERADRALGDHVDAAPAASEELPSVARLAGCPHLSFVVQDDFRRVRQIVDIHFFHFLSERLIFDYCIQLAVSEPACQVEVRRSHPSPTSVHDRSFGVKHRTIPLEYAHTCFEERPVARSRQRLQHRNVCRVWQKEANINPVGRSRL